MAQFNVNKILRNPVFIGAATAAVTWYLLDEVLEKPIKKLLRGKKKKLVRNKFGEVFIYDSDTSPTGYGGWRDEEEEEHQKRIRARWEKERDEEETEEEKDRRQLADIYPGLDFDRLED